MEATSSLLDAVARIEYVTHHTRGPRYRPVQSLSPSRRAEDIEPFSDSPR